MASYDDLDQLIVELKIARINAWMRSLGWTEGGATEGGWSNEYGGPYRAIEEVSGTDSSGEGGASTPDSQKTTATTGTPSTPSAARSTIT